MAQDKIPPAGLHPQLVKKLLDNLESNDAFRQQFQQSPEQALRSLGYTDPWACMQLKSGTLASPLHARARITTEFSPIGSRSQIWRAVAGGAIFTERLDEARLALPMPMPH